MGKFCSDCGKDLSIDRVHLCLTFTPARDPKHRAVYCARCGDRQSRCRGCGALFDCTHGEPDRLGLSRFCRSCGT